MFRNVLFLIFLTALAACAPVLSQSIIDASEPSVPFQEIHKAPGQHVGRTVVVGGAVIQVIREEGYYLVEILQQPLGSRLQPLPSDQSGGRFLARIQNLSEDLETMQGRPITVGGKVVGQETRPLDRTQYTYPVIEVEEYHLWRGWNADPGASPRFFWSFGVSGNL